MHIPVLSRERVRELDRRAMNEFGIPGIVLMENAGRGVADTMCQLGIGGPVIICCGPGNNGGDGFVIARHLDLRGYQVTVFAWGWQDSLSAQANRPLSDAATNLAILQAARLRICLNPSPQELAAQLSGADWMVDALLGTGTRGEPRPPLDRVIDTLNESGVPIMAVDLPSGFDCDTGTAATHTIRAAHTCTFVAPKPGFYMPGAATFTGQVHTCDIGAPRVLVEEMLGKGVNQ